jgi:enoyl-CoA hydratase/carnithine racemase
MASETPEPTELLRYEEEGPIRIVTLNYPEKRNPMVDPLHQAFTDVGSDHARPSGPSGGRDRRR